MTKHIRFAPSTDARHLQREFDRLVGSFFPAARTEEDQAVAWSPRLDLVETEAAYQIRLDVPGMTKEAFTIDFHEGSLSVGGERLGQELDDSDQLIRGERSFGRFYRSFNLPKTVDDNAISATYADGVLEIHVPKTEDSKPRRITVS